MASGMTPFDALAGGGAFLQSLADAKKLEEKQKKEAEQKAENDKFKNLIREINTWAEKVPINKDIGFETPPYGTVRETLVPETDENEDSAYEKPKSDFEKLRAVAELYRLKYGREKDERVEYQGVLQYTRMVKDVVVLLHGPIANTPLMAAKWLLDTLKTIKPEEVELMMKAEPWKST